MLAITEYLVEVAQQMANHESARTLQVLATTCFLALSTSINFGIIGAERVVLRSVCSTQRRRSFKTMPVITFASPKGGAGKTTAALLLATELAVKGFDVTVIDADPLKWIEGWSKLPDKPANLEVLAGLTEDNIIEAIDQAQSRSQFVIIDLEGTASTIVAYALSRSNFVLVPIQPSNMDARAGAMIVKLIRNHEQAFRIEIPFALFLTKTRAAIRPRTLSNILTQLEQANMPVFQTQLLERDAFRQLFSFGGTLETLNPNTTYKLDEAVINARAFAGEVLTRLAATTATKNTTQPQEVA